MAVGDTTFPKMYPIKGIKIGTTSAYIRYPNRKDLVIFELSENSQVSAIFTQNTFCAAPVVISKKHLAETSPRYLVINTGNANAGTGEQGLNNAINTCQKTADITGSNTNQILVFSTGVIGEQLPIHQVEQGIQPAIDQLQEDQWLEAALGIMTTDTLPKGASEQLDLDGITYKITGISKGAGMIRPNMATMLGFIATDLPIAKNILDDLLKQSSEQSFNRITIDGDTSTNDACILIATGQAGGKTIANQDDARYPKIKEVLFKVMKRLAQLIIRDGEGATKFITVKVENGYDTQECCNVAYQIAHSPLVKTALFASDPNWGRILAAIGASSIQNLDVNKVQVWLNDLQICKNGGVDPKYTEVQGQKVMQQQEITIKVDLNRGEAIDTVYTCDLSYDYVKINADYRS